MKKILGILLFLFCCCDVAFAQDLSEFSVVSFEEKPFDTAARDERYKIVDGNSALFSIIKLVAATPGDDLRAYSFDFGLCESRVKIVDGEVWVYVQRNATRVTIKRDGYRTEKYELPVTVQPGQVFEMELSAVPTVVKKRHLLFKIQPADSKAMVLYKAEGESEYRLFGSGQVNDEGMLSDKVVLGKYYYQIKSQNYHLSEGVIELLDETGTFTESVTLRSNLATVILTADKDTEIFIDGESKGFGYWKGNLRPGPYNVECRKENHRNSVESIEVRAGETMEIALKLPIPVFGTLDIVSDPLEATITIDGKVYGKTPAEVTRLPIGGREVSISKPGYKTEVVVVNIKEGKIVEQSVKLSKLPEKTKKEPKKIAQTADAVKRNNKVDVKSSPKKKEMSVGNMYNSSHEAVDLGLSVKWATCNVGAATPEEYGGYYAWGETEEKENYDWSTYKWCNGSYDTQTKYCTNSSFGTVDNKTTLDLDDDVAHVKWGGSWRMPTKTELIELYKNCTWTWTTQNGVKGYKVTSKSNGNSIFLPAAGYRNGSDLNDSGSIGYYWSNTLYDGNKDCNSAYYLYFGGSYSDWGNFNRYYGFTVRPVCGDGSVRPDNVSRRPVALDRTEIALRQGEAVTLTATSEYVTWSTTDASVATVNNGVVTAVADGTATIVATVMGFIATCKVTVGDCVTSLEGLSNKAIYHISQPHHSKGATSWAVASGGSALKSNRDLNIASDKNDKRQQFSILSYNGGKTYYLYHPAEAKYICRNGSLSTTPVDAIKIKRGMYDGTFVFYFDISHYINVGGSRQILIDAWSTADGGNSCRIYPVSE